MKEKIKFIRLCFLVLPVAVIVYQLTGFSAAIDKNLLSYLISVDGMPPEKFDAIYILGGSQENLKAKYKTSATLYTQGCCKEITILSRPGITEYNNSLGRNMTNDEWSLMFLENYGVPKKNVRPLTMESGNFGTYSEAMGVSKVVLEKDWSSLLLITSPHHTKRARKSFEYFLNKPLVKVCVIASMHQAGLFELLAELFKLKFYEFFLLTDN
jgi:uncharacterized SAM-binding protein YcdF (DUF218 family)